ncbi:MAG: phosphodiester glycosidase family protein, partial [Deltaproteobacteria bacterium]
AGLTANRDVLFAVDAGFFTEDMRPSGTLISRGVSLGSADARGGSGVLVIRRGRAELLESAAPPSTEPSIDLAVQCGPRLVERDGTVGIHRDDGRRFARTGACLRDDGRTLDVVIAYWRDDPMRGPGLLGFSQRLAAPSAVGDPRGCESALNLDGGPSTGVYVRGAPAASHDAIGPVPYALAVRAR